jgi:hypothetical protein
MGRLQVSESPYESQYDSVHDLYEKQKWDPIFFLSRITMVCKHISANTKEKITCWTPLAANRTPNRLGICMENRTCRTSPSPSPSSSPFPPPPLRVKFRVKIARRSR